MGGVHSIGSDLTRTKGRSDTQQNGSNSSEPAMSRLRDNGHNTPTSKTQVLVYFLIIFISIFVLFPVMEMVLKCTFCSQ